MTCECDFKLNLHRGTQLAGALYFYYFSQNRIKTNLKTKQSLISQFQKVSVVLIVMRRKTDFHANCPSKRFALDFPLV